jgi:predicted solute-binding protein
MFYAIAKNKIDLRGYRFEHRLEDIQTLNERAQRGELHISAISIHAYAYVRRQIRAIALRREHGAMDMDRSDPENINAQRPTLQRPMKKAMLESRCAAERLLSPVR